MPIDGAAPNSSYRAYAEGTDLIVVRDWRQLADLINDDDTRVASATAVAENAKTVKALRWASGMIESAATAGLRYKPEDLLQMLQLMVVPIAQGGNGTTTDYPVGKELLQNLTCDLAYWWLVKRRKAGAKPEQFAGVAEALDLLERLRIGEHIFPFTETQEAGLADVVATSEDFDIQESAIPMTDKAFRYFGNRG